MANFSSKLILEVAVIGFCMNFEFKCPGTSHRNSRAHIICKGTSTSNYYCLFDENRKTFVEQCKEEPDHVRPGEKYVITGRRRNVDCSSEKFQPFLFWSNTSSHCVFIKSKCNEPGQVLFNNGSTKRDRSCRCDYSRGFTFIRKPKNPCYCIPSEEDCSCYHTACTGNKKLTPDYECVVQSQDTFYSNCPLILHNRVDTNRSTDYTLTPFEEERFEFQDRRYIKYGSMILLFLTINIVTIYYKTKKKEQAEDSVQNGLISSKETNKETSMETVKPTVIRTIKETETSHDSPVKNRIENTRQLVLSETNFNLFVQTRAYSKIISTLYEKHYVVIKGNPGDGKTTLAYHAMRRLIAEQYKKPLQLFNYHEWTECVIPDENLAIFIDNLFGEHTVSYDNVTHWSQRFPMIKASVSGGQHSNYVIICIRNDIYNQCQEMIYNEFLNSAMVDISHGKEFELDLNEMKSIFFKYIPESKQVLSPTELTNLLNDVPKLGFPQCCHLYKDIAKLQEEGLDFFRHPLYFLEQELNARFHSKDMKMAVLVCILLYGGKVKKSILYDRNEDKKLKETSMTMSSVELIDFTLFQDAISNIETSFIVHEVHEDMIKFTHSSVQNALFSVVGKHYPHDLIKYCDYTLLSLITTSQDLVKGITMIVISENCSLILRDRILELLTRGSSKVLKVVSELNVLKDKAFFMKCQPFEKSFVEAVDENNWLLYVHFAAVGCIKWVKHLFNQISNKRQLVLALEVACGSNKLRIVRFLLAKNIEPNIRCCFNAVRGGYLDILKALVDANVDLCELDKTQSYWKIRSHSLTVMDEAALFNQCHLIEPLLKLCPKLIDCKSSCGTTPIHAIAMAGNLELLKKYIACETFSPYVKSGLDSTILHFACQSNRFETVKYIVDTYPDLLLPKYYFFTGGTVLHTAAQSGNIEMFEYVHTKVIGILKNNNITSIPLYSRNFVYDADGKKNQASIDISKLLQVRCEEEKTILHAAAWSRSIELFKYVATKSIDILGKRLIDEIHSIIEHAKTRSDNEDMVLFLIDTYDDIQPERLSSSDSYSD